ncbi:hypothetical protein O6V14_01185 [Sphingomonas faeni]|uniref:hypothetical protein n=1 Tax=Sphingomonas faeni TaxID=185950 RepID=UPI00335F716F
MKALIEPHADGIGLGGRTADCNANLPSRAKTTTDGSRSRGPGNIIATIRHSGAGLTIENAAEGIPSAVLLHFYLM